MVKRSFLGLLAVNSSDITFQSGKSANPVSDLKKEDLEQLIIQLILDRVLVRI